jgi:hypothetical protein
MQWFDGLRAAGTRLGCVPDTAALWSGFAEVFNREQGAPRFDSIVGDGRIEPEPRGVGC